MSEQETYYQTMNAVTAPVRFAIDMVKTALLALLAVSLGIGWPFYLLFTGQPVTSVSMVTSGLTILAVFTFFYTIYYFIFGGLLAIGLFIWGVCAHESFMSTYFSEGWGLAWLVFGFLAFGILQKFIRTRFDLPSATTLKMKKTPKKPNRKKSKTIKYRMASGPITWKE